MATPTRPPPGGHSSLSLAHVDRTAAAGVPSSNALSGRGFRAFESNVVFGDDGAGRTAQATRRDGATESTPIQTPTRRASTGVLPGHSTDELVPVYRPGRKPGPQHRHSLAFSSEAEPHQHLGKKRVVLTPQSSFKLVYDELPEKQSVKSLQQPAPAVQSTSETHAAGRRNVFATHNILNPPDDIDFPRPRSAMSCSKNKSSISFASPPSGDIVEPIRPHRRPHSTSSLKSNIVFGSDDSTIPSTSSPSPSKSRFGHLMNKSSIIFGDDGERAERPVGSKIPIPIRRTFTPEPKLTFAEFTGNSGTSDSIHTNSSPSQQRKKLDPASIEIVAGKASGKHRVF
ncbi:hypothetical protein BCR33DRAFT_731887 [Rhizoclosmatium globosum]|uniref:Uncharacterized protein n=1 Tax=Rhizoclosmatium globosum TaxID=329046 RepID=A0A1Y1ZQM8_9FUNG|nr:hypothetical protein BCR33DRAFT_731887 [Rhizoclosmatium globosum]|eukprot:ORY12562.1 hypothetical protein BCR33DRAFT_731887 [Rhizoclosmatium globosum]